MNRLAALKKLAPAVRMVAPVMQKRAAARAAEYLNRRRQQRITGGAAPQTPDARVEPEPAPGRDAAWPVLSGALVGAALGVMAGILLAERE